MSEIEIVRKVLAWHQTSYARFHAEGHTVIEADGMAIGYTSVELAKLLAEREAPPDLAGALEWLEAKWRERATWEHEHSVRQRNAGAMCEEAYSAAGARMCQLEECADELAAQLKVQR